MEWSNSLDYRMLSDGFVVAIGVLLAMAASFVTCLGLNLQKYALCLPQNADVNPWRQPRWVMGFLCVLVGSIIDFVAFGLAPQSLLAPLAALSLIWNLGMANYMLDEQHTSTDIKAVCLIFVGTALTVVFANHEEKEYPFETLLALYNEERMAVYGVTVPILLAIHYGMIKIASSPNVPFTSQQAKTCEMVGYAGFAGIVGGQSVLFAKSTMELIKDATHGDDVFLHIETYIVIVLMAVCLLTQITFLNGGLKRYDSLFVVPVYQSYWIISGVTGGLVYFGEWQDFSTGQMVMFILGTLITLGGMLVLTTKEHKSDDDSCDDDSDGYLPVPKPSARTASSRSLAETDTLGIDLPSLNSSYRRSRTGSSDAESSVSLNTAATNV
ncbi:Magnesium transporter NIPA2 [Hondaea fermentalgiana]|uniref:Magnesium transporter NIPA2 n=1 Tax=Hondaea fermentalgiana TaxID=2315210 RepID=A0A2R5GWT5_9STRA|nr:Magnesium transporter NIPA2 [Hondaea fermentalgiana]|eukprot:GBG32871.1 Magnesium transporter NIPA2 [Hondaea fermentalgiana]